MAACGIGGSDEGAEKVETNDPVESDDSEGRSEAYLAEVADVSAAESSRFEMWMDMDVAGFAMGGGDVPMAHGETQGDTSRVVLDMSAIFGSITGSDLMSPEEQAEFDAVMARADELTMEYFQTPEYLFMRMPIMGVVADLDPVAAAADPSLAPMLELADNWGVLDLSEMPDFETADIGELAGGQSADIGAYLDLLRTVGHVEKVGAEQVRGVETTHHVIDVSFTEMAAASGLDAATLEQQFSLDPTLSVEDAQLLSDTMAELVMKIDVFVDDSDRVRRISVDMSFDELFELMAEQEGSDIPPGLTADLFTISVTMEMFDYGAEDISLQPPDPAQAIDLVEVFGGAGS